MDTFSDERHSEKIHSARSEDEGLYQKLGLSDCPTSKSMRYLCLDYIGSFCALDKATLKAEAHTVQCPTAKPHNAALSNLLGFGPVCGLGPDLIDIHSTPLRGPLSNCRVFEHAHSMTWEDPDLPECMISLLSCALSSIWEK